MKAQFSPTPHQFGHRTGGETLTFIPADAQLRPLRDQIIVEAQEWVHSDIIHMGTPQRPAKGIVLAVGPGCYPKRYDHPEKHRRTKMWDSRRFRPTDVKVGDRVELGEGFAFEQLRWGDKLCIICREEDVCVVREG